jgi:hypothetical protein
MAVKCLIFELVFAAALLVSARAFGQASPKQPVPNEAEQNRAQTLVSDVYKED